MVGHDTKFKKYIFTFNKIYLHSRHYFTSSNRIFRQLQGIVCIQLQGNDILVNYQGNKFIQKTYIYSQKVQSIEAIIFFYVIIFISRNLSVHSRKCILVQGKHSNSGKLYLFKEIYSFKDIYPFKFKAICSFKETIFIEHCCVRGHRNIYSKIVPATL